MIMVTSERRCCSEAVGRAEEGLSFQHQSFTGCKQQKSPIPEEQILISQVARISSVALKRQLFFVLLYLMYAFIYLFDALNIIWSPNPHKEIWLAGQE